MKKTIAHQYYLINTSKSHTPNSSKIHFFMNHLEPIQDISGLEYHGNKSSSSYSALIKTIDAKIPHNFHSLTRYTLTPAKLYNLVKYLYEMIIKHRENKLIMSQVLESCAFEKDRILISRQDPYHFKIIVDPNCTYDLTCKTDSKFMEHEIASEKLFPKTTFDSTVKSNLTRPLFHIGILLTKLHLNDDKLLSLIDKQCSTRNMMRYFDFLNRNFDEICLALIRKLEENKTPQQLINIIQTTLLNTGQDDDLCLLTIRNYLKLAPLTCLTQWELSKTKNVKPTES